MSYRNDHDAALHRVDALQHEVSRLADENLKLRTVEPRRPSASRRTLGLAIGGMAAALIAGSVVGLTLASADAEPARPPIANRSDTADSPPIPTPTAREALVACAAAIGPRPRIENPIGRVDTDAVARTGAPCRTELRELAARGARPEESNVLSDWRDAEDVLANRISLLVVYYSSDPAALDNYATAAQAWSEYTTALDRRDTMLERWTP